MYLPSGDQVGSLIEPTSEARSVHLCVARSNSRSSFEAVAKLARRAATYFPSGDQVLARLEGDEVRITTLRHRLERAQRHVRQFVKPGVSLADDLIAERREAARHE